MTAERAGVPSVSVVATTFLPQGRLVAGALGIRNAAIVEYPGHPTLDSDETFEQKLAVIGEQVITALATEVEGTVVSDEPNPKDIVFKGTLDEVQAHFTEQLWSEGLP